MGFEGAEKNVMQRPPRSSQEGIFSGGMGLHVTGIGLLIGLIGLGVGFVYYQSGLSYWQSMIFASAAFLQIFQALATRSNSDSLFSIGVFSNRVMWLIIGIVICLQLSALYTPLSIFLGLKPLPLFDLLVSVALSSVLLIVIELEKFVFGQRKLH
jgi:Ca2+-transporting ATPase